MSRCVFVWVLALFHLLVVGCGGGGTQPIPQDPIAVSISPARSACLCLLQLAFRRWSLARRKRKSFLLYWRAAQEGWSPQMGHIFTRDTSFMDFVWLRCVRAARARSLHVPRQEARAGHARGIALEYGLDCSGPVVQRPRLLPVRN